MPITVQIKNPSISGVNVVTQVTAAFAAASYPIKVRVVNLSDRKDAFPVVEGVAIPLHDDITNDYTATKKINLASAADMTNLATNISRITAKLSDIDVQFVIEEIAIGSAVDTWAESWKQGVEWYGAGITLANRPTAAAFGIGSITIIGTVYRIECNSDAVSWYSTGSSDSIADRPSAALFGKGTWQVVGALHYESDGNQYVATNKPPYPITTSGIIESGIDRNIFFSGNTFNTLGSGGIPTVAYETDSEGGYTKLTFPADGNIRNVIIPFQTAWIPQPGDNIDVTLDIDFIDESLLGTDVVVQIGLAPAANVTVDAYHAFAYGSVGVVKQGRNVLRNVLTTGSWLLDGAFSWDAPVSHFWIRVIGTGLQSGTTIKLREVVTGTINVPSLCYGFDDAAVSSYPIFKYAASLGVRGLVAVMGNSVPTIAGATGSMSLSQLKDLQNWGFTVCSHTFRHTALGNVTYEVAYEEINSNKQWLLNNGFGFCPYIVWPGNSYGAACIQAALDLGYKYMRSHGGNIVPISAKYGASQPYRLPSFTSESFTLAAVKTGLVQHIDSKCALGILYNHVVVPGNPVETDPFPAAYTWYDGWHRALLKDIAAYQAAGKLQTISGFDLVKMLDNVSL